MSKENPNELKIINKNERLHYRQIINQLKQQLAEKQNTIDEINREFVQSIHDWKALCAEKDKEIERLKDFISCKGCVDIIKKSLDNEKQFAIQELEKVKEEFGIKSGWSSETDMCFDLEQFIKQQIKELEGEWYGEIKSTILVW